MRTVKSLRYFVIGFAMRMYISERNLLIKVPSNRITPVQTESCQPKPEIKGEQ